MTNLRQALFNFLDSKTAFTIINAMVQYEEPEKYVSFYILSDDVDTMVQGDRAYNATTDVIDISYSPIPLVTIQIDVRGVGSYDESRALWYGLKHWQDDMKTLGLHFRGVDAITTIPNVQNGYVKEGYQFNLYVAYDTTLVSTVNYGDSITWQ